jgi:hypothetical protein
VTDVLKVLPPGDLALLTGERLKSELGFSIDVGSLEKKF